MQAMFVTRIKGVLAVALVAGVALIGAAGLIYQAQAAEQPKAKEAPPAAKTGENVACPERPRQPLCHLFEEHIAHSMAERVVDDLEAIEVEEHYGHC